MAGTRAVASGALVAGALGFWMGGCGSSNGTGGGSDAQADAGVQVDAGAGAGDGPCNALAQLGAAVVPACDAGSPPAATGGALVDGTYVLTESHFFGACSQTQLAQTLVVSQGTVQSIATAAGSVIQDSVTFTIGAGATTLVETETCPAHVVTSVPFTATPTTLTIFLSNALATRVSTFTRL
jgi:hypothetical protein